MTVNLRSCRVLVVATSRSDLADEGFVNGLVAHSFHHGQVLEIVVRLEQGISSEELDKDAAYTPDITRETPSKVKYDFGGAVVAGRDDG